MSQLPGSTGGYNPSMPLQYAQSYAPPKLRPTSVTVLAIIGIIWGSLILLGSFFNMLQVAGVSLSGGENAIMKGMQDDQALLAWSIVSGILSLFLGVLLLFGSIWSLSLTRAGRSWLIVYSWLDIAFTVISAVISVMLVIPRMDQVVQHLNLNASIRSIMQMSAWGGILFSIVALVFPWLILHYMSRPHVKEAFQRGMVAPARQWGT